MSGRGTVRGPRRPTGPRSSAGARGPGGPHRPRHATAAGYAAGEIPEPAAVKAPPDLAPAPEIPDAPAWREWAGHRGGEAGRRASEAGPRGDDAGRRASEAGRRRGEAGRRTGEAGRRRREAGRRAGEARRRAGAALARARGAAALPGLRQALASRRAARRAARDARPAPEPTGELSGLRLLLDQLDALLRDPTLTLALRRFTDAVKNALRLPRLRLPSWLRLPRLPRWLLLPLLLALLGLGLISLLSSDDDDRRARAPAGADVALPGVGMPALEAAPDDPPPARVALVVGDGFAPAALRRELRSLGLWLEANHAPGTRVVLIDARTGRASAPLAATDLAGAAPAGPASTASAAVDDAFGRGAGRRLLVGVGTPAPRSGATTLTVATRRGAPATSEVAVRRGQRARVTIDDRRPDALAASVARALIAISNQREQRSP